MEVPEKAAWNRKTKPEDEKWLMVALGFCLFVCLKSRVKLT